MHLFSFSKSSQPRIDTYLRRPPTCTAQQAAEHTNSILNMLVTDMRPLSMVEGAGFKQMIASFSPQYELPSRTYFTKKMEERYTNSKDRLIKTLEDCDCVALTTDIWTSVAVEAFMGVTCHCVTKDWEMQSFILTTLPLEERHTAANIADWLQDVVNKFGITPEKIKAVVHDNGANVVAALKILREKHGWISVRCAAHTLNLVVQTSLKNNATVSKCVSASRSLVENFKKSELACTKLKAKQVQMGTPQHMLIQDVSTRWNSTHYMLSRLLEQRWPVTAALSDPTVTSRGKHHLDLKPEQWEIIEELNQVLAPFESATVFLSGQQYVTLSALPQLVHNLKKTTEGSAFETPSVKTCQAAMASEVQSRWEDVCVFDQDSPNVALIAAALDPRFRRLKFLSAQDTFKVQSTVQTMAFEAKRATLTPQPTQGTPPESSNKAPSLIEKVLGSSESSASEEDDSEEHINQTIQREVLMYFGENPLTKKEDPLAWWKANEARYPTLAKVAKSFLCIPATSTPSERLFSAAGIIVSKLRASLSSEHVDMLTFLHSNSLFLK